MHISASRLLQPYRLSLTQCICSVGKRRNAAMCQAVLWFSPLLFNRYFCCFRHPCLPFISIRKANWETIFSTIYHSHSHWLLNHCVYHHGLIAMKFSSSSYPRILQWVANIWINHKHRIIELCILVAFAFLLARVQSSIKFVYNLNCLLINVNQFDLTAIRSVDISSIASRMRTNWEYLIDPYMRNLSSRYIEKHMTSLDDIPVESLQHGNRNRI